MKQSNSKLWLSEPWFLFILGPLLISCVFTLIFVYRSIDGADDVVVGNYYKDGLGINQSLAGRQLAADLGLVAAFEFDQVNDEQFTVVASLESTNADALPQRLLLQLNHPVKEDMDRRVVLTRQSDGTYTGENDLHLQYRWYVRLEPINADSPWNLTGEINFSDNNNVVLGAHDG